MIAVELVMMAAFLLGVVIGELVDQRDSGRAARDDEWADEFISVLRGTSPQLFGEIVGVVRLDAEDFTTKLAAVAS